MSTMDADQHPAEAPEPVYTTWPWPGQSFRLSPAEPEPTADQVGRRPIRDVEALVADLERALATEASTRQEPFPQGVLAAFRWALGRAPAPFTQAAGPPDSAALLAEDDAANAAIYSKDRAVMQGFAVGVQHAAMWLRGKTQDAPWSI
ncbi:hypothetical protein [Streptacidiphilus sp. MAP5-52]|uniref:hypothetical protein n=1 Tax=Streptacidiphilus sp. MAP5-52 TaxID=3156267 RepID=UPI003516BB28